MSFAIEGRLSSDRCHLETEQYGMVRMVPAGLAIATPFPYHVGDIMEASIRQMEQITTDGETFETTAFYDTVDLL